MGMHRYKLPGVVRLPEDALSRRVAQRQARRILALRLELRLSRLFVVDRTGINCKRIRGLADGAQALGENALTRVCCELREIPWAVLTRERAAHENGAGPLPSTGPKLHARMQVQIGGLL